MPQTLYSHSSRRNLPRKDTRAIRYAKVTNTEKEYKKILTDAINSRKETINMCEAAERAFKKEREKSMEKGMEKAAEKMATKMIHAGKQVKKSWSLQS